MPVRFAVALALALLVAATGCPTGGHTHAEARGNFIRVCSKDGAHDRAMCTCLADEIIPKRTIAELEELDRQAERNTMPDTLKFLIEDSIFACSKKLER